MTELPLNCRSESDQKAIREQLDRILKSGPFLHAPRRQRFLEYIVNETLAGRGERLKGYSIAQEVFDRSDAFDPNVDPIVRVEAARVRDKLREYYGVDGRSDPIRIDLPKGSYTPHIEFRQAPIPEPQPGQPDASIPDRHLDPTQPQIAVADEPPSSAPPLVEKPHSMADGRAGLGAAPASGRLRHVALPQPYGAGTRKNGREPGRRGAQRPGDRSPPLRQSEWRPETRVF